MLMGNRDDVRSVTTFLVQAGVRRENITQRVLGTGREDWGRRVDVSFPAYVARLPECGNFDSDTRTLFSQWTNRPSSNLGCSVQRNMAAQLSDPGDLVAGRGDQMFSGNRAVGRIGDYNTYERPRDLPLQGGTSTAAR
jgi:pilus assembly protein CpaD